MIDPKVFYDQCLANDVDFFSGVPDSLLKEICACITEKSAKTNHVIAANEGAALSLGVGYHLGTGKVPLVYLQNSGLGNIVNPLLSIADQEVYSIPLLLMIGWRGEPGVKDEPQHVKQGRVMLSMLDAMEVPYEIIDGDQEAALAALRRSVEKAKATRHAVALVVKKGAFDKFEKSKPSNPYPMSREQAIQSIVEACKDNDAFVSTTGMASRELFEIREALGQGHSNDFLTVGGMGHTSQIALGLALAQPQQRVICVDGDGSALMHLGSLAINATSAAPNFIHIVINNGAHDSVGAQPTAAFDISLPDTAKAMGYKTIKRASNHEELQSTLRELDFMQGPAFIEVMTNVGARADLGRPTATPKANKENLMRFLGTWS